MYDLVMISKPKNALETPDLLVRFFGVLLLALSFPGLFIFAAAGDLLETELNFISNFAKQLPHTSILLVGATFLLISIYLEKREKITHSKLTKAASFFAFSTWFLWFTYR